jgi:two-component system sensor histidine kinase TctE
MRRGERIPSVRRRLLLLLPLPAIVVLLLGTISDFLTAGAHFRDAYDQGLSDLARAVAAHVEADDHGALVLALPAPAIAALRTDSVDSIYFRVAGPDGHFIAGDRDLPGLDASAEALTRGDGTYLGRPIRLVGLRNETPAGPVVVTAAETLHKRDRARAAILSTSLAVDLVEIAVILAIILIAVKVSLTSLRDVEAQIGQRTGEDLSPLPIATVPVEIRGVVQTLNQLFHTVRGNSEAQRRFLESAAHQLRTPLAGISAQLELLVGDEGDRERKERLAAALGGARRLAHTTQQLLTLARSDQAANLRWEFARVDLTELTAGVITERLPEADRAGIDLGAQIEPAFIYGVAWLLHEALGNLVDNSIAYTPAGGSITASCGSKDGRPFLRVVDAGTGIPAGERELVTDRFFRASNSRGTGSGLGLAIVREVAQLHGASLVIDAGPDGTGTSIEITFPAR